MRRRLGGKQGRWRRVKLHEEMIRGDHLALNALQKQEVCVCLRQALRHAEMFPPSSLCSVLGDLISRRHVTEGESKDSHFYKKVHIYSDPSVCLSVCVSVSVTHTHTHKHSHAVPPGPSCPDLIVALQVQLCCISSGGKVEKRKSSCAENTQTHTHRHSHMSHIHAVCSCVVHLKLSTLNPNKK